MKLQTGTSLALYSILEAAGNSDRQISAADIATKYGVSIHHLAKVLRELGRAGLVESSRGVGGGYRFVGNAKRLTLMDIIELFEDIGTRQPYGAEGEAVTDTARALDHVLSEIDEIAKATFRSITIATMLRLIQRQGKGAERPRNPA
jgi:Rrf2 family protein